VAPDEPKTKDPHTEQGKKSLKSYKKNFHIVLTVTALPSQEKREEAEQRVSINEPNFFREFN
jgi:hypothetical protein